MAPRRQHICLACRRAQAHLPASPVQRKQQHVVRMASARDPGERLPIWGGDTVLEGPRGLIQPEAGSGILASWGLHKTGAPASPSFISSQVQEKEGGFGPWVRANHSQRLLFLLPGNSQEPVGMSCHGLWEPPPPSITVEEVKEAHEGGLSF